MSEAEVGKKGLQKQHPWSMLYANYAGIESRLPENLPKTITVVAKRC